MINSREGCYGYAKEPYLNPKCIWVPQYVKVAGRTHELTGREVPDRAFNLADEKQAHSNPVE